MSETPEKTETKVLNLRVKLTDHEFVTTFLKDYEPKHAGFSALCNLVNTQNADQNEALANEIDILKKENETLKLQIQNTPPLVEQTTLTATDFVPANLIEKVNLLHRDLLIKKQIPESSQTDYLNGLLTHSLKYFLLNEYPKIYNR